MKQYGYEVKINQICVHHEEEDEPYGFWESTYNNTIDPFFKRNDEYPDVTCPYEFKDNDKAYVVWAVWNSGDSFGNSTDGYASVIGIFKDENTANDFKRQLEQYDPDKMKRRKSKNSHVPIFKCLDGQKIEYYPGWFGYFESLSWVNVNEVVMYEDED